MASRPQAWAGPRSEVAGLLQARDDLASSAAWRTSAGTTSIPIRLYSVEPEPLGVKTIFMLAQHDSGKPGGRAPATAVVFSRTCRIFLSSKATGRYSLSGSPPSSFAMVAKLTSMAPSASCLMIRLTPPEAIDVGKPVIGSTAQRQPGAFGYSGSNFAGLWLSRWKTIRN